MNDELIDARRYAAVLLRDDSLSSVVKLKQHVRLGATTRLKSEPGWSVYRTEFLDSVHRYSSFAKPGGLDWYPHDGFVCFGKSDTSEPWLLVVSPFARLLQWRWPSG